jgi:hypothetical protein
MIERNPPMSSNEKNLEKKATTSADSAHVAKPITSAEDNAKHEREQARLIIKAFRLTTDRNNSFTIDMGDGKQVQDKRPIQEQKIDNDERDTITAPTPYRPLQALENRSGLGGNSDLVPAEVQTPPTENPMGNSLESKTFKESESLSTNSFLDVASQTESAGKQDDAKILATAIRSQAESACDGNDAQETWKKVQPWLDRYSISNVRN